MEGSRRITIIHGCLTLILMCYIVMHHQVDIDNDIDNNNNSYSNNNNNNNYNSNYNADSVSNLGRANNRELLLDPKSIEMKETSVKSREPRLGDGCYHVFIDAGANLGVHGRFLLEPDKYPLSERSVPLFEKEYAPSPRPNEDYCVFEIEANPRHWEHLQSTSATYKTVGWRYHVIQAAVSDRNENMEFFHQGGEREVMYQEWGFSSAKDNRDVNAEEKEKGSTEVIPAIRLSEWIQYHIMERDVPSIPPSLAKNGVHNEAIKQPILGMKMDIEGSEYTVLPDLIHSGALCNFNFIFGEFHARFAPLNFEGMRVSLQTTRELDLYAVALVQVIHASRNCKVRWATIDDESYRDDGQPFF